MRVASNFPTAYVRVASQTYVLQHINYCAVTIGTAGPPCAHRKWGKAGTPQLSAAAVHAHYAGPQSIYTNIPHW